MNSTTVLTKSSLTALDDLHTEKLHAWHRERLAVIYVRQSTPQQVLDHQESTRLQYGLVSPTGCATSLQQASEVTFDRSSLHSCFL